MEHYLQQRWLRNQMEGALWRYLSTLSRWGCAKNLQEVPQVFRSRIKKLLNIDRMSGDEKRNWLFYNCGGGGTGSQESYSDFHVFMMGLALHMLNIGFKQSEIIFFLQNTQNDIQKRYHNIRSSGGPAPIFGSNREVSDKDSLEFMLINRIEMNEILEHNSANKPLIFQPTFVNGLSKLQEELFNRPHEYTAFITIELSDLTLALPGLLNDISPAKRGRPSS
jgi:hypothetical protein